jgi:glycosyltransferase involved in cell wall biosynthesis
MKISIITITARTDYPYDGRPDLHIFEPTIESLKTQTMTDFEWIIVDFLYEERKDYFKNKDLPFKVKHIPSSPNIWHDVGLPGVSTQYNKGIIYADGELIFFSGEGFMYIPTFCEKLWNYYKQGYIPLTWYFFDNSFMENPPVTSPDFKKTYPDNIETTPVPYNICEYTGKNITVEHRPLVAFKNNFNNPNSQIYKAPWEWYFGCSATSMEALLKINGFDQKFDGDRMLLDCDVGSRLQLAGFNNFALFKDLFFIRVRTKDTWNPKLSKDSITVKCNMPLIRLSRNYYRFRANDHELTDEDINWMKNYWCRLKCPITELCKTQHPWQYPFEHKGGYAGHNSDKKWFDYWRAHQEKINLTEERNKRLSGDKKYEVGTFI